MKYFTITGNIDFFFQTNYNDCYLTIINIYYTVVIDSRDNKYIIYPNIVSFKLVF